MSNNHRTIKNVTQGVLNRIYAFFARHLFPAQLRMPFYKAMGVKVGKGSKIAATVEIDMSAPELITIGKNVWVTRGVMLLCHQRDLSFYEIGKPVMDCPLKFAPIHIHYLVFPNHLTMINMKKLQFLHNHALLCVAK